MSCSQKSDQSKKSNTGNESTTNLDSIESTLVFYNDSILTSIDAEALCEFNFDFFLPQLNQKLNEKDFKLDVQTVEDYENSFEIIINGHRVKLYSKEELSNGKFWDSGPRNFFRVVNDLLKEKNIDKQFYLLYSGNDLNTVFLTKQQFELMSEISKGNENETPYLP